MSQHVFGDESKAHGLLLAAAYVPPGELASVRSLVNGLRKRGQQRVHFCDESPGRRKQIIRAMCEAPIRTVIYDATLIREGVRARRLALGQLVDDALAARAVRLVLERDDSLVGSDLATIKHRLRLTDSPVRLYYEHHRAHDECLLSVPDAVAWCWAKGGEWRKRAEPLVGDVQLVEDPGGCSTLGLETRNPACHRPEDCRVHFARTIAQRIDRVQHRVAVCQRV